MLIGFRAPWLSLCLAVLGTFLGSCRLRHGPPTYAEIASTRTVQGITYKANLTIGSVILRADIVIENHSSSEVVVNVGMGCPVHIQIRTSADTASSPPRWDSKQERPGWECAGGLLALRMSPGATQRFFTEVSVDELNAALKSGTYLVLVQPSGQPSPGWIQAGLVTIPVR